MNIQFGHVVKPANIACLSFFLSFSFPGFAQEAIEEEIIVTATKFKQPLEAVLPTAHVITAVDIERLQPRDLPSLLGRISGVDFRDSGGRGSTSGVFVRGMTPSQIIVLIDGVRSASATTGATALGNIPVEAVERIEVVKSPLSGLYGADALGGVIQIFTKKGKTRGLAAGVRLGYGSHNTRDYGFNFSGGNQQHQFFAAFSREDTDGIDRTELEIDGNNDEDAFDEKSGNLAAAFTLTNTVSAQLNYLKSEGRSEFDNVFGTDLGRYSKSELETAGAKLAYRPSDGVQVSVDVSYLSDHIVSYLSNHIRTPVSLFDIQTRRKSASLQGDFQMATAHQLTLGANYDSDDVSTLTAFTVTQRDNEGYFAQLQSEFGRLNLVGSLRYDDNEAYGDDTNGSLALLFPINESIEIVASYGTAFKAPSFNDLYFPGFGNADLLPEESQTVELTLRARREVLNWRISAYQSEVDNLIGIDPKNFTAKNINSATLEGLELEVSTTLAQWRISGNIDYLEARDDNTREWLDDRALVSVNLQIGRQFNRWYLGIDGHAEHGRHDQQGRSLAGYGIWGISALVDVTDKLTISARAANVFDKDYTVNLATRSVAYETEGVAANVNVEYSFQ